MISIILATMLTGSMLGADPSPREMRGTELIVEAELAELDAPSGEVRYVPTPKLSDGFPGYLFVTAQFPLTPKEELPNPLQPRNLFAVAPDGTTKLLATAEDVLDLFRTAHKPIRTAEDAKKAAQEALALEQAKYPEQEFQTTPDSIQAKPADKDGFEAAASSQPAPAAAGQPASGTGPISVRFRVGPQGPVNLTTVNNYQPPPRRRRAISPADIAADQPTAQQAAGGPVININSPTINKTLPGITIFGSPPVPSTGKGNKIQPIVVVGQDGKAQAFSSLVELGQFVCKQYGPVTTKKQARDIMETYLTLAGGLYPAYKFQLASDADIKVTDTAKGGLNVVGKMTVLNNANQWIMADWTFGSRGQRTSSRRAVQGLQK